MTKQTALLLAAGLAALSAPALSQTAPVPPPPPATPLSNGAELSNGSATIRVTALTDTILRIRIARGAFPEDASWAVPAEVRRKSVQVEPLAYGFQTGALMVNIDPKTLRLTVNDLDGKLVHADAAQPLSFGEKGFTLRKTMPVGERYYGMGDKTGPFDRRGASYVNWNTDAWGFERGTDPIYKSIPFFVSAGGAGGAYGLFLDNTLPHRVRLRPPQLRPARNLGRRRTDRLLPDRRPDGAGRRAPLHRPDGQAAAAAALVARLPAVALQLHDRRRGSRARGPPRIGPHPDRRHLARHRLPGPQPAVHGRHEGLPEPEEACRRHGPAGHQARDDHRPARRARAERGLRALRQRPRRRSLPQEPGRQHLRRAGLAGRRRSSPTSPARPAATGGATCTRASSTTASPVSGTT